MKKLINKIWNKTKNFLLWVWHECKDWKTLVLLGIVCLVIGLPVWCGYLLFLVFHWSWAFWVASICWAFWMLPGAPFFALCVSITLIIKKIYEKTVAKRLNRGRNAKGKNGEVPVSPQSAEESPAESSAETTSEPSAEDGGTVS